MLPLLRPLLLSLLRNRGSKKAIEQVIGIVSKKVLEKSALLRMVKNNLSRSKVDYVFDKELRKRAWKRALRKPSLREQWKRLTKRSTLRGAFRTLSWDYIKKQFWFAKNQGRLLGPILSASKIVEPVASARATEKSILRRLITTNKKQVIDSASLRSSWLYSGTWRASTAQEDYWLGTLTWTTKKELKDGRVVIGKTYTTHNFPLTVWSLMKAALGRDGKDGERGPKGDPGEPGKSGRDGKDGKADFDEVFDTSKERFQAIVMGQGGRRYTDLKLVSWNYLREVTFQHVLHSVSWFKENEDLGDIINQHRELQVKVNLQGRIIKEQGEMI